MKIIQRSFIFALLCALINCGGGGGGGAAAPNNGSNNTQPSMQASVSMAPPALPNNNGAFTNCPTVPAANSGTPPADAGQPGKISGRISFDRIPFYAQRGFGLDYSHPQITPARGVVVEAVQTSGASGCTGTVVDTQITNGDGWYEFSVDPTVAICVRVRAQLYRVADQASTAAWNFAIGDNTNNNNLYVMTESSAATSAARPSRDLHAASGWTGAAYTNARAAAPFAVLDTVCKAMDAVITAQPSAAFGQLVLFWSINNTVDKNLTLQQGNIDSTHFNPQTLAIYLQGDADVNTDEFDETVIAHEFGHFVTATFSRSDSIGGAHYLTDKLDPRLAFEEGWATAFSGLTLNTSIYRDSLSVGQEYSFDILLPNLADAVGWYGEASIQKILFSIGADNHFGGLGLGVGGLLQTLTGSYKNTPALTSIFSFGNQLKNDNPAQANGIAAIIDAQTIQGDTIQPFAATETNASSVNDLPVYQTIGVVGQGGVARTICSNNAYNQTNKLSNRRYLKFTAPNNSQYHVTVQPQTNGRAGVEFLNRGVSHVLYKNGDGQVLNYSTPTLTAGNDYVFAVFHTGNALENNSAAPGFQCFTVSVVVGP